MNKYESNVYKNLFEYPTKKIVELEFKNEVLENENQLLKKQKADVIENIKKQITFCTNEAEGTINNKKCWISVNYLKKILRMLGEIDE